jgi:hypothetical protein
VTAGLTNEVYGLSGANGLAGVPNWFNPSPTSYRPEPRSLHSLAQDPDNQRLTVFGGLGVSGRLMDAWVLEEATGRVVDVPPPPAALPRFTGFSLPPAPNPSTGTMSFSIALARDQQVEIEAFDVTGRRVALIHRGVLPAGTYRFAWNGLTQKGLHAAPGIYLLQLRAEDRSEVRRVCRLN